MFKYTLEKSIVGARVTFPQLSRFQHFTVSVKDKDGGKLGADTLQKLFKQSFELGRLDRAQVIAKSLGLRTSTTNYEFYHRVGRLDQDQAIAKSLGLRTSTTNYEFYDRVEEERDTLGRDALFDRVVFFSNGSFKEDIVLEIKTQHLEPLCRTVSKAFTQGKADKARELRGLLNVTNYSAALR